MKILHFADVHYCREYKDLALASLRVLLATGAREKIDLWALAGDLFDRSVANTDKDGFPELVDVIHDMLDVAPMVCVRGTITHDVPGCYDILMRIRANHRFTLLQPGRDYYLAKDEDGEEASFVSCEHWSESDKLLILGLPEPTKAQFLAGSNGIGKDEANEKIKQGLREILLGYGAVRKNNPSIPCLFLYHGSIGGSRACNGQTLTGDIEISKDDIRLIDSEIVSSYSGSVYPVDWGELDQKSFTIVDLKGNDTYGAFGHIHLEQIVTDSKMNDFSNIKIVPFPHAPRKKIVCSLEEFDNTNWIPRVKGFQVWMVFKDKAEALSDLGDEYIANEVLIKDFGALPGTRVTTDPIPTETVRAIEIQAVKSLTEKIQVWAKNSELEVRDSVLEKARLLEAEAKKTGILPQPHAWRLQKVRTRGLKGIRRGMGLDEYEIDFDKFNPGLIALVAENGTGKTTMMLNCHMYPSMLTFDKKLQDYFCLRDSYREVYAIDDMTGTEYRARMLIDGKNASGKAEYYLDCKQHGEYVAITTGKTKDYEEKVIELFGSEGLYLRSAFIPSKPSPRYPDLSYVAQGEKKRIFYELSGIGFYAAYCDRASKEAKSLRIHIESNTNMIKNGEGLLQRISDLSQTRSKLVISVDTNTHELATIEEAGKAAKTTLDHFAAIVKANNETQAKIDTIKHEKGRSIVDLITWERKLESAKSFTTPEGEAKRKQAIADIEKAEKIKEQIQLWTNIASEKIRKRSDVINAYSKAGSAYNLAAKAIEEPRDRATTKEIRLQAERKIKLAEIDRFLDEIEKLKDLTVCPTCGEKLPPEKQEAFVIVKTTKESGLKQHQNSVFEIDQDIAEQKRIIEAKTAELKALVVPEIPNNTELDMLITNAESEARNGKELLAKIDITAAKAIVKAADEARTGIVEAESQIAALKEKIDAYTCEIEELEIKLDPEADRLHSEAATKLEAERKRFQDMKAEIASAQGQIKSITDEIEDKLKRQQEIEELKVQVEAQKNELRDWEFLVEACGIDGIPALELDAVAPEISATANSLLENAYGQRFQIEFRTTKISGSGSKKKQVEDFAIWITDAQDSWTQPYETLSGGEETWIKKAISDAFEIIKAKNTGVKFLTVFQDELDGKLSPHNRQVFFKLLEKTHEQTGRHHTVVVTHSEQVQEQIAQKIEMRKAVPV